MSSTSDRDSDKFSQEEDTEPESVLSDKSSNISEYFSTNVESNEEIQSEVEVSTSITDECVPLTSEKSSFFIGRDMLTKWQKSNNNRVKSQVQNILTEDFGVRRNGVGVTSFEKAWNLFISENIIEEIVISTNEFIQKKVSSYSQPRDCKTTDAVEVRALLGLLYIAGAMRISHANLEDLYATDGTGISIFPTTMSLKRTKFLLNSLRFDDPTTRASRCAQDKAAPIRSILEKFTDNCLLPYSVGQDVVIDEMMTDYRGKCPFRQYIKSKPGKCGIKLYPLVDATTFYVLNIELYAGNQPDGPHQLSNTSTDIVKRLITPISGTGRNLTIVNWCTSIPLVEDLIQNHKISVVGRLREIEKEIPSCFIDHGRPEYSCQFGFSDRTTLVSYVPKKNSSEVLISSLHCAAEIDESTNVKQKPSIITFYNKIKGSVDQVDKKVKMYTTSRKNNRWPLALFFRLLDIAGINAMVILRENGVVLKKRRLFLRALGIELTKEYVNRRAEVNSLPRKLKKNIKDYLHNSTEDRSNEPSRTSSTTSRGSCKICPAQKRRQSKTQCTSCLRNICREHTTFVCNECYHEERPIRKKTKL